MRIVHSCLGGLPRRRCRGSSSTGAGSAGRVRFRPATSCRRHGRRSAQSAIDRVEKCQRQGRGNGHDHARSVPVRRRRTRREHEGRGRRGRSARRRRGARRAPGAGSDCGCRRRCAQRSTAGEKEAWLRRGTVTRGVKRPATPWAAFCRVGLVEAPNDDGAPWRGASSAERSSNGVTRMPASIGYGCSAG